MPERKSSSKSPAFQFYVKQWLGDDKILLMDWDARGMHVHLLCIAWQQENACTLPADDELLQRWCGNPNDWDRLKSQIFRAWRLENDRWIQDGLLREFKKQREFSESRKRAAEKRWSKEKTDAPAMHVHSIGNALQSSSSFSSADIKKREKRKKSSFPQELKITEEMLAWAEKNHIHDLQAETEKFLDHHRARSSQFSDWQAAWRNWMRKSVEFKASPNGFHSSGNGSGSQFSEIEQSVTPGKYDHLYE